MKKVIFTLAFAAIITSVIAQKSTTISSINDGNWLNPLIWSCSCVPMPGDNIIVRNHVILDTSWTYGSDTVFVNTAASLKKDNSIRTWYMTGGALIINGSFEVDRFATTAGSVVNSDTMIINQALYSGGTFTNSGILKNVDSLDNAGTMHNTATGVIHSTNFWNYGTYTNQGRMIQTHFLNTITMSSPGTITTSNFTNIGTCNASDSIMISSDFMNLGTFTFNSSGFMQVNNDFLNDDSLTHTALFVNNGFIYISNDFTNTDTLKGSTGRFCVAFHSTNTGYMKGSFDFCDLTPTLTVPIHIDVNTGTIGANITSCLYSCNVGIADNVRPTEELKVYPNPFNDKVTFELTGTSDSKTTLNIFDMLGNKVFSGIYQQNEIIISRNLLKSGVYSYSVENNSSVINGKLVVE